MGFNPLFTILKDTKLTGPNYIEWKRNLDIMLTAEEYKFCTYEPKPNQPAVDAPENEKEYYKRWIKELFGDQNRAARQVAIKALMNTQMAEGTQIDIILMSLSKSFEQFCLNYNMNKRLYSLMELLTEIQAAEGLFRQSVQVKVAEKGYSSKPKGIKKKKKAQTQKAVKAVRVQGGVKKPKGKCFRCKQSGHWKQDCPLPKKTNNTGHINLRRIQRLVVDGPLSSLAVEPFPVCESCLKGKMTNRPFKSEFFDKFKEYKAKTEKRLNKNIKSLRSDRGGEYLLGEFREYLSENGIESQLTAPGKPQQNGVAERRNQTLLESVRSMMSYSDLPKLPHGYSPKNRDIIVSTNARFLEEDYIMNHKPMSSVILEELVGGTDNTHEAVVQVEQPQQNIQPVTNTTPVPRRSGKVIQQPDRFMFLGESSDLISGEHDDDPVHTKRQ
ncbi:hypothetical protein AgCh_011313 [Apium graveolens]